MITAIVADLKEAGIEGEPDVTVDPNHLKKGRGQQ